MSSLSITSLTCHFTALQKKKLKSCAGKSRKRRVKFRSLNGSLLRTYGYLILISLKRCINVISRKEESQIKLLMIISLRRAITSRKNAKHYLSNK